MLYEFTQALDGAQVSGIDISEYGIENAKEEVRPNLMVGNCKDLPYEDNEFDFVFSINTFHNLFNYELHPSLQEMQRVGRGPKHITIESYRNEQEKANLLYWQLTCESFFTPQEWQWVFTQAGYSGDHGFIYFE